MSPGYIVVLFVVAVAVILFTSWLSWNKEDRDALEKIKKDHDKQDKAADRVIRSAKEKIEAFEQECRKKWEEE